MVCQRDAQLSEFAGADVPTCIRPLAARSQQRELLDIGRAYQLLELENFQCLVVLCETDVDENGTLTGFGSIKKQRFYRCLRMHFARTRQAASKMSVVRSSGPAGPLPT